MHDAQIISLYFERNESAIKETDNKYGHFCTTLSNNIVHNLSDAEECVNDTYLKAWNSIPPTYPHSLQAYLGKITRNISLNLLKAKTARKRSSGKYDLVYDEVAHFLPANTSLGQQIDEIFLRDSINRWLATLPDDQRFVFIGRYWYFDSTKDIAAKTGFSVSKVKMTLLRCRNSLRSHLESEEYDV